MATIVRVKRRRDADPLEILHLAVKKQRQSTDDGASNSSSVPSNEFKFAGTVNSKNTGVSQKVKDAIRKEKLEREYKRHQADIVGEVHSRVRDQTRQSAVQNRFTITSRHRALALDKLDDQDSSLPSGGSTSEGPKSIDNAEQQNGTRDEIGSTVCKDCLKARDERGDTSLCRCNKKDRKCKNSVKASDTENTSKEIGGTSLKENNQNDNDQVKRETQQRKDATQNELNPTENGGLENYKISNKGAEGDTVNRVKQTNGEASHGASSTASTSDQRDAEGAFCLVDMEMDGSPSYESLIRDSLQDQITCNGEAMVREIVSERRNDDEYVYDIYYTNDRNFDFRMFETDLTFESRGEEAWRPGFVEDEYVYEDDLDDENAESNWRNDYPEEDPGYVENQETDYVYPQDMAGIGGGFDVDDANQLADWMSWRCNLEDGAEFSSDDDDTDPYDTKGSTYEAYYKRVQKEMKEDSN